MARSRMAMLTTAAFALGLTACAPVAPGADRISDNVQRADEDAERGSDASPAAEPVRLAFAGDTYAEGVLGQRLADRPTDFVGPFAEVLRDADIAMLNLETAITTRGVPEPKQFHFRTTPDILPALAAGGVDVVSMANNHGMDFGRTGLADSLEAKHGSQQPVLLGIGQDDDEAYTPWITTVRGHRIAFLAVSRIFDDSVMATWGAEPDRPGVASAYDEARLLRAVQETRRQADTVVVFIHWGTETMECPTTAQTDLAPKLAAAGADIVVGGHQHRVAGAGMLGGTFVSYGMGNFLFQAGSPGSASTGVLVVDVAGRDVKNYRWVPGQIVNGVPTPLTGRAESAEQRRWKALRNCTGLNR